ncbi:hypothetical protein F4703DRAFT_1856156, partial [Phycomyces blakesleeanus]
MQCRLISFFLSYIFSTLHTFICMYLCINVICICIDHSYILSHLSLPFSISLSLSLRSHTLLNLPFFSLSLLTIRFFSLYFTLLSYLSLLVRNQ